MEISLNEILNTANTTIEDITLEEVEAVLKIIQSLEPAGVGARGAQESLLIQLNQLDQKIPEVKKSKEIIMNYFELLVAHDYKKLTKKLKIDESELKEILSFIKYKLNARHGEEAMKPLILQNVADSLGMHESTISRATTKKYMQTPRGTYELKYFFPSHVSTDYGHKKSSTAIQALIKKFIDTEEPTKPLSDEKISILLKEEGVNVARRTIAKYREAMAIPTSNERKRLSI